MPGLRVAVIGAGTIGSYLTRQIQAGRGGASHVVVVADCIGNRSRLEELSRLAACEWSTDVMRIVDHQPDLAIEAAGPQAVREYAIPLLERGVDLLIMSAGALADTEFVERLHDVLQRRRRQVFVPSGAIGGLDVLRAASLDGIDEVRLTTSKPPQGLRDAPWFAEHPCDLNKILDRTTVFRGSVLEAVRAFPQNVNVAAILSLASLGARSVSVEVVADPSSQRNIHEVYARGNFGEMTLQLVNVPSPDNPKTSHLACLSPLALLQRLSARMVIGS
jgi:aspartate dehydrogenase